MFRGVRTSKRIGYFWTDEVLDAMTVVSLDTRSKLVFANTGIIETVLLVLEQSELFFSGVDDAEMFWNAYVVAKGTQTLERDNSEFRRTSMIAASILLSRLAFEKKILAWLNEKQTEVVTLLRAIVAREDDSVVRSQLLSVIYALDPEDKNVQQAFARAIEMGSTKWNRSQIFLVGEGR
jgi:hypothetical protein